MKIRGLSGVLSGVLALLTGMWLASANSTAMAAGGTAPDTARMQELDAIVGNAPLVNFGESSHFMQGLHSFVAQAFRHLAQEKGFRVLVFESAWGVDDAMQGFFASDRAEPTQDESFFLNAFYSRETIELLKWIREFNRQHPDDPIRVAGYQPEQPVTDFEAFWTYSRLSKQAAAAKLDEPLKTCKAGPGLYKGNLDFFRKLYESRRVGKPTYTDEERSACLAGLDAMDAFITRNQAELTAASSPNAYREARLHVASFRSFIDAISREGDNLALNKTMTEAESRAGTQASYTRIDQARFDIFQTLRQTRYAGKKMMLWMHDWHATRHSEEVETIGIGGIPKGTISLGTRLAKAYGDKMVTIGSIVSCPSCMVSRDDAVAPKFAAAFGHESALIDLRRKLPSQLKITAHASGAIIEQSNQTFLAINDFARQFDAIYYLPESRRVGERADPEPQAHYFVKSRLLIDPATGRTFDQGIIEVSAGRILRVGTPADLQIPSAARVYDFGDKFVIPGLIEMHGHMYSSLTFGHNSNDLLPRLYLLTGVTSVLAPGSGNPAGDIAMRQMIDAGMIDGSRLFLAGEYIEMAPAQAPWMDTVATEKEAKMKVERWHAAGATAIKVYAGMKGDILRATIAQAHWLGMRVHGHLGATSWEDAIDMGIDAIHHGIYDFPDIEPPGMPSLALGAAMFAPAFFGFDKYYKAIVETDLGAPKVTRILQAAARSRVVLVPTVVTLDPYDSATQHMDEQRPFYSAEAWKKVEERIQMPKNAYAAQLVKKNLELVRRANDLGVLLATGTDITTLQILPGYSLWREMELFGEAGLKPMDVLKAATLNGAIALGRSDNLGSIEPGKLADFVVLDANPLEKISNVRAVHRVVKGGVVYDPAELRAPLMGRVH
jgi:imidazolonepropionase-like amidohydrolase/erythromycin esterase-like protein